METPGHNTLAKLNSYVTRQTHRMLPRLWASKNVRFQTFWCTSTLKNHVEKSPDGTRLLSSICTIPTARALLLLLLLHAAPALTIRRFPTYVRRTREGRDTGLNSFIKFHSFVTRDSYLASAATCCCFVPLLHAAAACCFCMLFWCCLTVSSIR